MKIAIHHREGSFSEKWIEWCHAKGINIVLVDAYQSDIVKQLTSQECTGFMWHWSHGSVTDQLFARQLTFVLEAIGISVFPNSNTAWHYDDKLAQKYLFDAHKIPSPVTEVFYAPSCAKDWLAKASYPLVFKLRGGAGSMNVHLVDSVHRAYRIVDRAFGKGFPALDTHRIVTDCYWRLKRDRKAKDYFRLLYYMVRNIPGLRPSAWKKVAIERNYVYFQEFIQKNSFDDRFVVIGNRCFALRRAVRKGDFRASGSGVISYGHSQFQINAIRLAFHVATVLKTQCIALDIVYKTNSLPVVVEISYAFSTGKVYEDCDGYWDKELEWHDAPVRPEEFMIIDFVRSLELGTKSESVSHPH